MDRMLANQFLSVGVVFVLRQASEQYLTDSQFLAQAFRHVISRPHATHGLLGR